jgi:ABC-2 type transport system ATP-binding protein
MTPAISVTRLTRRYRSQLTLDQVSLDIEAGAVTGLLGRNGAGKPATELRHSLWTR